MSNGNQSKHHVSAWLVSSATLSSLQPTLEGEDRSDQPFPHTQPQLPMMPEVAVVFACEGRTTTLKYECEYENRQNHTNNNSNYYINRNDMERKTEILLQATVTMKKIHT